MHQHRLRGARVPGARSRALAVLLGIAALVVSLAMPATSLARTSHAHSVRPSLKLAANQLTWNRVKRAGGYVLAVSTRTGGHTRTTYVNIKARSYTPVQAPGAQVRYRVRVARPRATYSNPVTISFPKTTSSPTTPTTTAPTAPSTPVSTSRSDKLRVAVMNTTGWGLDSQFANAGIHWTRLDVGDGSDISLVQKAVNDGVKPLVLYNPGPNGGLGGVSPATAAAQVKSLAQRILPLGLTEIEFGNEVYYAENATTYAAQYAAAHTALAGMGIKLLAVGTAVASGQAGYSTPTWMADFVHALPGGASEVDAWTIHPYGYMNQITDSGSWGWPTLAAWHNIALGLGSTAPWYITEVGQCLSGCAVTTDQAGQAAAMTQYLNDVQTKYPWVSYIDFYAARDDSTGQFGLLNSNNSPRPAMTALSNWMSANAANVNG